MGDPSPPSRLLMDDLDDLKPSCVLALLPFSVAARPSTKRQADICRGFSIFLQRRIDQLPGVGTLLHNFIVQNDSDPSKKGWLLTNTLWTVEQLRALPLASSGATHVLQGLAEWSLSTLYVRMELVALESGDVVQTHEIDGTPGEVYTEFFFSLGRLVEGLTGSASSARLVARVPTTLPSAFRNYLIGIAWAHAFQQGLAGPDRGFLFLTRALREDPEFHLALDEAVRLAEACLGHSEAAAEYAQAALDLLLEASPYPAFSGLLGLRLADSGDTDRAEQLLGNYVTTERTGRLASDARRRLADLHSRRQEYAVSLRLLQEATRACPENAAAWEDLARLLASRNQTVSAEEAWRRALQEDPERPEALVSLARVYTSRDNHEAALHLYARARDQGPLDLDATLGFLQSLLATDDLETADEVATALAEETSDDFAPWEPLFRVRRRLGDLPAAEFAARRLAVLARTPPEREIAHEARFALDHPQDHAVYTRLRAIVPRLGPGDALADQHLRDLHRLAQRHAAVAGPWRLLLEAGTRLGSAVAQADAAAALVELFPDVASVRGELAEVFHRAGRHERAARCLRVALHLEPSRADWHERLGDFLLAARDFVGARDGYQAALEHGGPRPRLPRKLRALQHRPCAGIAATAEAPVRQHAGSGLTGMIASGLLRIFGRRPRR